MRTILLSILAALFILVPNAAAHTYLDTTNPEDGAVVTELLQSIELTYTGKIEVGSTFKVISSNGEEIETVSMDLVDGVLTGTFDSPLPNDDYTVEWNSISADGHPLSGQFSFTVDAPVAEEPVEEKVTEENEEQVEVNETVENNVAETTAADEEESSNNTLLYIVGALLLLIIMVSIFTIAKRKNVK
ncbi:copper resistance CopC family protein [Solibacillus sp. FSL K6-1126]|uniref:copper resistance CopC family protein n=1 Tax=Solibacillus sp. FSL K6-1126 TaxID=2921463 RepID=UPI0030FA7E32